MLIYVELFNVFIQGIIDGLFYTNLLKPKYNKYKIIFIFSISTVVLFAFMVTVLDWREKPFYRMTLGYPLFFLGGFIPFHDTKKKKFIVVTTLLALEQIICAVYMYFANIFIGMTVDSMYNTPSQRMLLMSTYSIILFAITTSIGILCNEMDKNLKIRMLLLMFALPFSQMMALTALYYSPLEKDVVVYGSIFMIAALIINIVLYFIIDYTVTSEKQSKELQYMKNKKDYDFNYYKLATENANKISTLKHEMNNQLQTAYALVLLNDKNIQKSTNLLDDIDTSLDNINDVVYCDNQIINTILSLKTDEAQKYNIQTEIKTNNINNISDIEIEDIDLCSLFSNLYDNSIESCKKYDNDKKYINIDVLAKGGYLIVKFTNPCDNLGLIDKNNTIKTTKEDTKNHGYGLKIINSIAKKYDGETNITYDDNIFQISAFLKIINTI